MILVDTSIWVDHLRRGEPALTELLNASRVVIHPYIVGELACGNLKDRETILTLLKRLPTLAPATDEEVLFFIEKNALMGRGIGYIDAYLLAATALEAAAGIWTRDNRLATLADALSLAYTHRG